MTRDIITVSQTVLTFDNDYERAYLWRNDPVNGMGRLLGGIYTGSWNYGERNSYSITANHVAQDATFRTLNDAVHGILSVVNSA